ncbi:SELENBP1-like protein [Aphelenchoides fujianensis]|nr:SELENBP1-like protein [Aphelenchoides fujianensis]
MTADEKVVVESAEMPAETNGGSMASTVEIADSDHDCCASSGIPYATPADACKGPREKILFVTCPNVAEPRGPDALVSVDVDPDSATYCQVLSKLDFPHIGDEVHHSGWNACASCFGKAGVRRTHLILPCLHSSRIYIANCKDPHNLTLEKTVEPEELKAMNVSFPHTSHCLADGTIMISTLGDANGNNRGEFILLDGTTFELKGRWGRDDFNPEFHYDYWYQPRQNVMMSSEWGNPNFLRTGFNPAHVQEGHYGKKIHVFDWKERKHIQTIELEGATGLVPLELRFLHDPDQKHAFVGAALGSAIYHLYQPEEGGEYKQRLAATVPSKWVKDWAMTDMPALITDIIISMDDRYMYISGWLHGEIRQYDISDPFDFKLTGQSIIGGLLHRDSGVAVLDDDFPEYDQTEVKGRKIDGGPQMMQLSLDGKRLYVTTSLYTVWDQQFYPALMENGAVMLLVDVDTEKGGMKLNEDFLIDFGKLPGGPYAGHEMRYPNGDCTTDVWL